MIEAGGFKKRCVCQIELMCSNRCWYYPSGLVYENYECLLYFLDGGIYSSLRNLQTEGRGDLRSHSFYEALRSVSCRSRNMRLYGAVNSSIPLACICTKIHGYLEKARLRYCFADRAS